MQNSTTTVVIDQLQTDGQTNQEKYNASFEEIMKMLKKHTRTHTISMAIFQVYEHI